jgi:hypothetical protein
MPHDAHAEGARNSCSGACEKHLAQNFCVKTNHVDKIEEIVMKESQPDTRREVRYKQIVNEARFLLDRLDDLDLDDDTDDLIRDWNGHVEPSIARLRSLVFSAA